MTFILNVLSCSYFSFMKNGMLNCLKEGTCHLDFSKTSVWKGKEEESDTANKDEE
jgi:hypothetical protein